MSAFTEVTEFLQGSSTKVPSRAQALEFLDKILPTEGMGHITDPACPWARLILRSNSESDDREILQDIGERLEVLASEPSALPAQQQIKLRGVGVNLQMLGDALVEEDEGSTFYCFDYSGH